MALSIVTADQIRQRAGFVSNTNVTDAILTSHGEHAEAQVCSALSRRYVMPIWDTSINTNYTGSKGADFVRELVLDLATYYARQDGYKGQNSTIDIETKDWYNSDLKERLRQIEGVKTRDGDIEYQRLLDTEYVEFQLLSDNNRADLPCGYPTSTDEDSEDFLNSDTKF